jgi:hypothetical protein
VVEGGVGPLHTYHATLRGIDVQSHLQGHRMHCSILNMLQALFFVVSRLIFLHCVSVHMPCYMCQNLMCCSLDCLMVPVTSAAAVAWSRC